jgi:hypothetical protein
LTYKISELNNVGLSVLAISRHSDDCIKNKKIMGVDTKTDELLNNFLTINKQFEIRLVCVLQKDGVNDLDSLIKYLDYAKTYNIKQICFKELYVASTFESIYSNSKENVYSKDHRVNLDLIIINLKELGFKEAFKLPWGEPCVSWGVLW